MSLQFVVTLGFLLVIWLLVNIRALLRELLLFKQDETKARYDVPR